MWHTIYIGLSREMHNTLRPICCVALDCLVVFTRWCGWWERGPCLALYTPGGRVTSLFEGRVVEVKCPIFRWVEITSIWWEATLTIQLRRERLEVPMQSLNQLPMVTDLVGARSAWSRRSIPVRSRKNEQATEASNLNITWRWSFESQRTTRICACSGVAKARRKQNSSLKVKEGSI
jgi:hypothetical protein